MAFSLDSRVSVSTDDPVGIVPGLHPMAPREQARLAVDSIPGLPFLSVVKEPNPNGRQPDLYWRFERSVLNPCHVGALGGFTAVYPHRPIK